MVESYLEAVEQELCANVTAGALPLQGSALYGEFINMLRYHLGWTDAQGEPVSADVGKRMRPLLCLLSCEGAGGEWRRAVPAAAAIELVHNFSLIHDDIQDNSALRRGRPTVWKIWGPAHGINAGDAMFVLARLALDRLESQVDPATYSDVQRTFDRATLALTQGQFLDLYFESRDDVTEAAYVEMVCGKTAALLACTCQIGARVATADTRVVAAFSRFGENLGIAFQIADDILGIWGKTDLTGKSARSDILARKKSLPLLMGAEADKTGEIKRVLARPSVSAEDAERVAALLDRVGAREYAERQAQEYAVRAEHALDALGFSNEATEELRRLAHRTVVRKK